MHFSKHVDFNVYLSRVKSNSMKSLFQSLADEISAFNKQEPQELLAIFKNRLDEYGCCCEDGVALFDVQSDVVESPILFLATLENGINCDAPDGQDIDIVSGLISPQSAGSIHLQKLSNLARLLRSDELCSALRDVHTVDEMKVLFMPMQDWTMAA